MESKHTKGTAIVIWTGVKHLYVVYLKDELGVIRETICETPSESHANFISEAFNVANEIGKTPRQLAEENKELLETLKSLVYYVKNESSSTQIVSAIFQSERAIQKASK